jgi:hypothetical protein
MRSILALVFGASFCLCSHAQNLITINPGARIYVDAASGFDTELAAAIKERGVPVAVTNTKEGADYELEAVFGARRIPASAWSILWGHGDDEAALRLVDLHTSEIIFVYLLQRSKIVHDRKATAEACARQLKFGMTPASIPAKQRVASTDTGFDF